MSSTWKAIDTIAVHGRLSISDTSYFWDAPLIVNVQAGNYRLAVRVELEAGHRHVAAARVTAAQDVSRGNKLGDVLVDFGQLGFCDRDAIERAFESLDMDVYYDQLNTEELTGRALLPGSDKILYVRTGFGSGSYSVYELLKPDGTRAGIEVNFTEDMEDAPA